MLSLIAINDVLEQLSDLTASVYWRLNLKLGLNSSTLNQLKSTYTGKLA